MKSLFVVKVNNENQYVWAQTLSAAVTKIKRRYMKQFGIARVTDAKKLRDKVAV